MHFDTLSDFFAMGGYAFYVWFSYGLAFLLIAILTIVSVRGRRNLFNQIRSKQVRDQKLKEYRKGNQSNEPKA